MKLKYQILLIFIGITLTTITIEGIWSYYSSKNALLNGMYDHLESVAVAKELKIKSVIQSRKDLISSLQNRELLPSNLNDFLLNGNEENRDELNLSAHLATSYVEIFKDVHILNLSGEILASSNTDRIGYDISYDNTFKSSLDGVNAMRSFYYDHDGTLIFLVGGLIHYEGKAIGVIMAETFSEDIMSIILDFTGLGNTGETTLTITDEDGYVIFITPTRHFPEPGLRIHADERYVFYQALDRKEGLFTDLLDYRDEEVIAVTRYIHPKGWGLVAKIDKKEVFAQINEMKIRTIWVAAILIGLTSILAFYFANFIVTPLKKVSEVAQRIGDGDYSQKISYKNYNEIGQLAETINKMSDKLQESQRDLSKKVEELNLSNESLQRFSYVVSHDLKSPLNNVTGLLNLLRKKYVESNDEQFQQLIHMMITKTEQMRGLIDGILHYHISGSDKEQVDLNDLVQEVTGAIHIPEHIRLKVQKLPQVSYEKIAISQVFQNLLSNAVKFMDKETGLIEIGVKEGPDHYLLYVKDNGPGIPTEDHSKVFELFNKVNKKEGVDSSGVGLSITKKIIEDNGGRIWLESQQGQGTIFYFTVPK